MKVENVVAEVTEQEILICTIILEEWKKVKSWKRDGEKKAAGVPERNGYEQNDVNKWKRYKWWNVFKDTNYILFGAFSMYVIAV